MSQTRIRDQRLLDDARRYVERFANSENCLLLELYGPSREYAIHALRKQCWEGLYRMGLSTPQIGWMFGRDHSTILVGLRNSEWRNRRAA